MNMQKPLTERYQRAIRFANAEAVRFSHEYIGTEHILLALLRDPTSTAIKVLEKFDTQLPRKIRNEVDRIVLAGLGEMVGMGTFPLTPRAKKIVEFALDESNQLNHRHLGTEHLLLGCLREQEGVAAQVLMNLGLTLKQTQEEVRHVLGPMNVEAKPEPTPTLPSVIVSTVQAETFGGNVHVMEFPKRPSETDLEVYRLLQKWAPLPPNKKLKTVIMVTEE